MKVTSISNNLQFKAMLPKSDLRLLTETAKCRDDSTGIPKLCFLLESLAKMPGENAELKTVRRNSQSALAEYMAGCPCPNGYQLIIDGKLVMAGANIFDVLYSYVNSNNSKDDKIPKHSFEMTMEDCAGKTEQDIENLLRD